jgi:hypothetical protein
MSRAANDNRKKHKIGNVTALVMVMLAVLFDIAQFGATFLHVVPAIGNAAAIVIAWFIAILSISTFALWFALSGVNYISGRGAGRRMLIALSAVIVELVPIIDALPGITIGVIGIIIESRISDAQRSTAPLSRIQRVPQIRRGAPPRPANNNTAPAQEEAA